MKITEIDSSLYCTSVVMDLHLVVTQNGKDDALDLRVTHHIYSDASSQIDWESVYMHDDILEDEDVRDEVDRYVRRWAIINTKNFI